MAENCNVTQIDGQKLALSIVIPVITSMTDKKCCIIDRCNIQNGNER